MKIDLKFTDTTFSANATIIFKNNEKTDFEFILNNDLVIEEITCNDEAVSWKKIEEIQPQFRGFSQKILIQCNEAIKKIIIKYAGTVTTWHNVISDDMKVLSWYSVWFPQETSIPLESDEVHIHELSDYFLVKGVYDETTKIWTYGNCGFDPFNIIAYKKSALKTLSNPYLNIYYVNENDEKAAKVIEHIYSDVMDYFNGELFDKKEIPVTDMPCHSNQIELGAYKRKGLVVTSFLSDDELFQGWLTAHEMGHEWCTGAVCASWEDWLNETTAEWSAMLYALKRNNIKLFDWIINQSLENSDNLPPIKTADGSRPEGVHHKGTLLFYEIYKKYGVDVVCKLVQIFANLDIKTTERYLQVIKKEISPEIATYIEEGLEK